MLFQCNNSIVLQTYIHTYRATTRGPIGPKNSHQSIGLEIALAMKFFNLHLKHRSWSYFCERAFMLYLGKKLF